jgi:hypothetical protein
MYERLTEFQKGKTCELEARWQHTQSCNGSSFETLVAQEVRVLSSMMVCAQVNIRTEVPTTCVHVHFHV